MSWKYVETLPWQDPLVFAAPFSGNNMALLYSGLSEQFTGSDSYLLLNPAEVCEGSDWALLPPLPMSGEPLPLWVGYLGYGMRDVPTRGRNSPISLPDFRLIRYTTLYHFDHIKRCITHYGAASPPPSTDKCEHNITMRELASNLSRTDYERVVADTVTQIHEGQFYQANITRKFYGSFSSQPDRFAIFKKLAAASPAPYSAFIQQGESAILSSSPECFLRITADGMMTTRPIKGSARRSNDSAQDTLIAQALANSPKNHAENLMIVDLMRNDLARVSAPESVKVIEQSGLYSYATIHHLISTIQAKKLDTVSAYDAVHACFPAGSMTGAPKIAAMRWCATQEKLERGVYSGAIGWFGAGDSCDLSVVIRTLILDGDRFEFQVGGGIVADSTPEDEWRETLVKARGICAALGLSETAIASL